MVTVAVEVAGVRRVALSRQARNALAKTCAQYIDVRWLPAPIIGGGKRLAEPTSIILFLLGVGFASLAKPVIDGIAKEAGKDIWLGLKKLVSGLWKHQARDSYALQGRAFIVVEQGNEFVAIELVLPRDLPRNSRESAIDDVLDRQLSSLADSWHSIETDIRKWKIGQGSTTEIHVIKRQLERWSIAPRSREFFGRRPLATGTLIPIGRPNNQYLDSSGQVTRRRSKR